MQPPNAQTCSPASAEPSETRGPRAAGMGLAAVKPLRAILRSAFLGEQAGACRCLALSRSRRSRGSAFLLLVPFRLRFLLLPGAPHLSLGHDHPPVGSCCARRSVPRARACERATRDLLASVVASGRSSVCAGAARVTPAPIRAPTVGTIC